MTTKSAPSPWRDPVALLAAPAVIYLLVVYAFPLLWLFMKSLTGPGGLTIQPYVAFLSDPFNWRIIGNTLRVAAWVTVVCFVIGYPAAFALARAGAVLQIVMLISIILPLSVGAVVKAFAWQIVLRRDGIVRQFRRGAERMQSLDHPNIVRVLTLAEEEDRRLFFVMELMPGGTLKELIRGRRLSVDAILPIARALGSALAHAHARKILHRDVEPSNVLFDADGQPRLADFDLALDQGKIFDTGLSHAAPAVYVAPECLSPHPDARPATDVYGLAMTILFMYAGVPPVGVLSAPRRFIGGLSCPPPVKRALLQAVSFSPRRRFATMDAFLAALDAAEVAWWRRRTVLIAAGLALLLGVLLATCSLLITSPPPPT